MIDLEMMKLCAEAMNLDVRVIGNAVELWSDKGSYGRYDPRHDDAQAMALVKRFGLEITHADIGTWRVHGQGYEWLCEDTDLNHAIVECVSKMKTETKLASTR